MSVTLAGVRHAATEWKQLTPFSGVSELRLHGAGLEVCVFHLNGRLDEARSFARAVEAAAFNGAQTGASHTFHVATSGRLAVPQDVQEKECARWNTFWTADDALQVRCCLHNH